MLARIPAHGPLKSTTAPLAVTVLETFPTGKSISSNSLFKSFCSCADNVFVPAKFPREIPY